MQTTAVQISQTGGPEVLSLVTVEVGQPEAGEVQIRQSAIGLNFADIYQRRGGHGPHSAAPFPITLGSEGAGTVGAIGAGVEGFRVGQSVASLFPGAYQAIRNIPASRIVALPEHISTEIGGATLARGLTAHYLLHRLHVVKPGQAVLVHAAAGGMGTILSQWARGLGATVIGTVGSPEKVGVAYEYGCHHVIDYRASDFADKVLELTGGLGVDVVYDAVGRDVFLPSLNCLRPLGMAINYGTASGEVEGLDLSLLHPKSLTVARPTLKTFISEPGDLQHGAAELFDAVARGLVKLEVTRRYSMADVRRAHAELESRNTTGSAVLIP